MNYKFWTCQSQAYSLLGIPLSKVLMTMAVSRDFYLSSYTVADPPASQAVFDHGESHLPTPPPAIKEQIALEPNPFLTLCACVEVKDPTYAVRKVTPSWASPTLVVKIEIVSWFCNFWYIRIGNCVYISWTLQPMDMEPVLLDTASKDGCVKVLQQSHEMRMSPCLNMSLWIFAIFISWTFVCMSRGGFVPPIIPTYVATTFLRLNPQYQLILVHTGK